jgi:hypothetical protein
METTTLKTVDGQRRNNKSIIEGVPLHNETFIDGVWYPSATTIIGAQPRPWLQAWKDRWGERATRKTKLANLIGTEFHRCVEDYLNTGDYSPNCVRVGGMMRSFVAWAQSIDGTIDHTELKVISKTHIYSGTLDAVGKIGKTPMLVDWKTSSRIYPDMALQLSAYAEAYNEMNSRSGMDIIYKPIKEGLIVHISKDKPHFKLTTKQFKLGKRVFAKFLKLRQMFDEIVTKPQTESANEQLA